MSYLPLDPKKIKEAKKNIRNALATMKEDGIEFDFIVVRGNSGAMLACYAAEKARKPIILLRKGESSHGSQVEMPVGMEEDKYRYIIVDDLIWSGATIVNISIAIKETFGRVQKTPQMVGMIMYNPRPVQGSTFEKDSCWDEEGLMDVPIYGCNGLTQSSAFSTPKKEAFTSVSAV